LLWLQDKSEINRDNLNNVRLEDSRHFNNNKGKYPKDKINYHAKTARAKKVRVLYRGMN
jgi:hypothetical protein